MGWRKSGTTLKWDRRLDELNEVEMIKSSLSTWARTHNFLDMINLGIFIFHCSCFIRLEHRSSSSWRANSTKFPISVPWCWDRGKCWREPHSRENWRLLGTQILGTVNYMLASCWSNDKQYHNAIQIIKNK